MSGFFSIGTTAEDLDKHPKIPVGGEAGNLDAAKHAAKDYIIPTFRLHRQRLLEVRSNDGNVVHALALVGKKRA